MFVQPAGRFAAVGWPHHTHGCLPDGRRICAICVICGRLGVGNPTQNGVAIAEEVTLFGNHERRPDIVLYVNGIAVAVLEA